VNKRSRAGMVLALLVCLASVATAQRGRFFYGWDETVQNIPYDGRFTFARVRYTPAPGGNWAGGRPSWVHGYPLAEQNLMRIMKEVSLLDAHIDDMNVVTLDDPELFKYPIAYIIEVGWWTLTDREASGLRAYLQKGGFLIVDDFPRNAWGNFELQMSRVFPEARWTQLDAKHQIFHSFFEINDISHIPIPYDRGGAPEFYALFEDNNPSKRMQVIVNYQNDISEFWEYSGSGTYIVSDTNEAYKIGVNEFLYGITH